MQAHRALLETDEQGRLKDMPVLPPRTRVEAIFLVLEEPPSSTTAARRPPSDLSGLRIQGDVITPPIDASDWSVNDA
ncbi:hypothetical protein [Sorangium sp. So ce854]|uniref:hypothetical protein n=1 Tax=Sorangium sp. So ce854 TaxID=3133322 RepID=UPI003F646608